MLAITGKNHFKKHKCITSNYSPKNSPLFFICVGKINWVLHCLVYNIKVLGGIFDRFFFVELCTKYLPILWPREATINPVLKSWNMNHKFEISYPSSKHVTNQISFQKPPKYPVCHPMNVYNLICFACYYPIRTLRLKSL